MARGQSKHTAPSKPGGIKGLKIIPVDDIEIIPWPLLEQLRGAGEYEIDDLIQLWNGFRGQPTSYLWAIVNKEHQIVGAVWSTYVVLTHTMIVNFCTLDKSIQGADHAVVKNLVVPALRKMQKKLGARKIWFLTNRDRAWRRMGFRESHVKLMEV